MHLKYKIPHLALFRRCRKLNEEIAQLRAVLPDPGVIAALERVDPDSLPPEQSRIAKVILRDKAELTAKEAELEEISTQAEKAAQQLSNGNLRRIVRLYCIDGMNFSSLEHSCACSRSTITRWIYLLKNDEPSD